MHGCVFALTIAWLLVERTSFARPEASKHVQAPGVVRASTTFADLGDDVMEELARDFERELDVIADELQTVRAEATAPSADGCSSSGGGDDDILRRALDDQELRALFEELERSTDGDGEDAAATVASAATATARPSIDATTKKSIDATTKPSIGTAAVHERGRSNASTIGNNADTSNVDTTSADTRNASTNGNNAGTGDAGTSNADTSNADSNAGTRGRQKRRKRRRRTPRRTPSVQGSGRSQGESSSSSSSSATGELARHRRRRRAKGRSAAGACRSAAPRHRSRAARKSAPSSAISALGAKGAAAKAATATTSTATGGADRSNTPNDKVGVNVRSKPAAVQQQQQRRRRQQHQQQQQQLQHQQRKQLQQQRQRQKQIRRGSFGGAAVAVVEAEARDAPRRGSEGSPLRRLRGVLMTAAIMAAVSTAVSGRRWPRRLVLVAVPLVHVLAAWMANLVRTSSRDTRERILGVVKIAVVLASAVGVYLLTMALTQPLSGFREKNN